jgi:hypothetical protein
MHRTPSLALFAMLALTGAVLSGCTASAQPGAFALYVKDAPSDEVTHLDVTFGQVAIHKVSPREHDEDDDHDGERDDDADEGENSSSNGTGHVTVSVHEENESERLEESGWVILSNKTTTVDLKALSGNASAFLAGADVPAGSYNQIRLSITNATATLPNGTTAPVIVPSGALRLQAHFTVSNGNETAVTLDFDLDHALIKTGDGKFILKPVLHMDGEEHPHLGHSEWRHRAKMRDEWSERRDHDGHGDDRDD